MEDTVIQRWDDLTPEEQQRYTDAEQLRAQLAALIADVDRYGADQWRRGAGNRDPQEFEEWRRAR
jgi:hypothetical protein